MVSADRLTTISSGSRAHRRTDSGTSALPKMALEFGASNVLVQITVTAYLLGMSVAFLPAGLIADALGRRRIVLAGLALLTVTSLGCVAAQSLWLLLRLRFVQGLGAGACLLLAGVIAADCFRGRQTGLGSPIVRSRVRKYQTQPGNGPTHHHPPARRSGMGSVRPRGRDPNSTTAQANSTPSTSRAAPRTDCRTT